MYWHVMSLISLSNKANFFFSEKTSQALSSHLDERVGDVVVNLFRRRVDVVGAVEGELLRRLVGFGAGFDD